MGVFLRSFLSLISFFGLAFSAHAIPPETPSPDRKIPSTEETDHAKPASSEEKTTTHRRQLDTLQVTASMESQPLTQVAAAVSVVTRDDIFSRPNVVLADLLRDSAGIYVQQTTPGQGIPIIRGLKGSQNLHLVDGIRLNTAFFRDAPNQYLALVDPFWADQIEVIRGPSSVLYGGDAMGGVVNIISHRPAVNHHKPISGESYLAWYGAENLALGHARMDISGRQQAASIAMTYLDSGLRRIGGGQTIPFTNYRSQSLTGKGIRVTDQGLTLGVDLQHLKQPATPRVDALIAGFGQTHPDAERYLFAPNQRDFVHIFMETPNASGWYDNARYQLAWQKIIDQRQVRSWQETDGFRENNQSHSFSAKATWNRQLDKYRHLLFGLESWQDTIRSEKWRETTNGENPVTPRFPDRSQMRLLAAFAEYRIKNQQQQWNLGVRHSRYHTSLRHPLAPDSMLLTDWSGHVGWLLTLSDENRLFANLGRGFRPPNIFDLGQLGPRPGNRFNVINPQLKPESLYSLDFGWKHSGTNWHWQSAIFLSHYRDKITSVFTGETTPDGLSVVQSQNLSRVRLFGLENEFEWYGTQGQRLRGSLNYVWGQEKTRQDSEAADRIPPLNGSLSFFWPVSHRWIINMHSRFAASQRRLSARDRRDARINPQGTGGFAVFDVFLNWHPHPNHSLRLGVQNLFDKRYREHGSGLEAPGRGPVLSWHLLF